MAHKLDSEEIQVYSKGSIIDTIKFVREHRGISIKEAHDLVRQHEKGE